MSGISGITSSLLSNSLLSTLQSNSSTATNSQTQSSGSTAATDTVSLTSSLKDAENEALLNAQYLQAGQQAGINSLLGTGQGSDDSGSMYNILLSAANAKLMEANPALLKTLISADQAQTASSGTSSGSAIDCQTLQDIQNINLLTINPNTLASLLEKSQNSAAQATSGSLVNQTV